MPIVTLTGGPKSPAGSEYCDNCHQLKDVLSSEPPELFTGCKTCQFCYYAVSSFDVSLETRVEISKLQKFTLDNFTYYEIFKLPHSGDAYFSTIPERDLLPGTTRSESTFWSIEQWTQDCLSEHEKCPSPFQSSYFPKRVLDVSDNQVVLREGLSESCYACLSHCWGVLQSPIKTLKATIDNFMKGIPWSSLSKTFQDAVDIYSEEDWNTESLNMGDIYENSYLTIAATMSLDGTGGCYSSTDPESVFCRPVVENLVFCRKKPPELNQFYRQRDWPLLSRAWVYQEMRLSPRVLHFGSEEVIWQCRTCRKSESRSNDSDATTTFTYNDGFVRTFDLLSWHNTVHEYSHLALTFEKDRFAALAAVARREAASRGLDDEFMLGLWKNTLLYDLLWHVVPHQQLRERTKSQIPTWTWASVMSRVMWLEERNNTQLQLLGCTSLMDIDFKYLESTSPYLGKYENATLHIRGPLISTTFFRMTQSGRRGSPGKDHSIMIGARNFLLQYNGDYDLNTNSTQIFNPDREVYFIPVATQTDTHLYILGLALINCGAKSNPAPEYSRIGMTSFLALGPPSDPLQRTTGEAEIKIVYSQLISHLAALPTSHIRLI
ncbi:HET-domain-containing protein [Annulohypoxylon stygium]|nr:HET-domain-containing protein [Annulohypoxylon stygium]